MKRAPRLCAYAVGMAAVAVLACAALRDGEPERKGCLEVSGHISEELARPAARKAAESRPVTASAAKPSDAPGREAEKPAEPLEVKALSLARAVSAQRAEERQNSGPAPVATVAPAEKAESPVLPAVASVVEKPASPEAVPAESRAASAPAPKPAPVPVAKAEKPAQPRAAKPAPSAKQVQKKTEKPARAAGVRSSSPVEAALADARAGRLAPAASKEATKKHARYERVVTSAKYAMKGSLIKLVLKGNAPMVGNFYVLSDPDRVVLDLAGNWDVELPKVPSNRLISSARVGQHDDKTRLVFDMKNTGKVALVPLNRNALELRIQ